MALILQPLRDPFSDERTAHLCLLQYLRFRWVQLRRVMRDDVDDHRLQGGQTAFLTELVNCEIIRHSPVEIMDMDYLKQRRLESHSSQLAPGYSDRSRWAHIRRRLGRRRIVMRA